jgi:hypothetical protein
MSHRIYAETAKAMLQQPGIRKTDFDGAPEPCTTSRGQSGRCQNPLCAVPIELLEAGWRRTERLYCSDECKQQTSLIRRVGALLNDLADEEVIRILRKSLSPERENGPISNPAA